MCSKEEKAGLKNVKRCLTSKIPNLLFSNIKAQIQENSALSKKKVITDTQGLVSKARTAIYFNFLSSDVLAMY